MIHAAFLHVGGAVLDHRFVIVARAEPAPLGHIESVQIRSLFVP